MDENLSKSQKKRQANALQELGMELVKLSNERLNALAIPDRLYKAIQDAKLIKSHEAKRRQAQLIGKLMRTIDCTEIKTAYEQLLAEESAVTSGFHTVELWRTRLIQEGKEALTEFIDAYQPDDVQHLRQLIKKAVNDELKQTNTGASKALFRYLRGFIT